MATITAKEALEFITQGSRGRFFSCEFIKRTTGEYRKMLCRYGVRKDIKGVGLSFKPKDHDLVVVWDRQKGYRMIPLDSLIRIKINGEWVYVNQV